VFGSRKDFVQSPSVSPVTSPPIVPRWEWRAFAEHFGIAEDRFDALSPERVEDSDEMYLLSLRSDASVKVRGGVMDVKRLEQVNEDGLEQWLPVMKAAFPLSAAQAGEVLAALGAAMPFARAAYTLDQLVDELVRASSDLLAVQVHKRREHYTIGGCMAERTEIRTDTGTTRTIAVESQDPTRVAETVRELGLALHPNVNVPRGLEALVGFGVARRYAVIDIGTNSVKFHIAERRADGVWHTVIDRAEVTRLGQGLAETGRLDAAASERTIEAIADMTDEARRNGAVAIAAVGTAGFRLASNSGAFVAAVRNRCGVEVEILSGEEEARLGFMAATSGLALDPGSLVVFDAGGGSTELTFGRDGHADERFSLDVGAVSVTERYGLGGVVSETMLATALDAIAATFASLRGRPRPDAVVAIGGTVTNLAAVKHELATYDPEVVHGTVLDRIEIDRQIELYRTRTAEERREIVGLQPKRADIILAGACIVRTVIETLGRESLTVSDRGLRHSLLVERFGP
jgi:exopolyphosphatase / guanosine-5'-triphosphate,3'-diphosphate pyrophosphatase